MNEVTVSSRSFLDHLPGKDLWQTDPSERVLLYQVMRLSPGYSRELPNIIQEKLPAAAQAEFVLSTPERRFIGTYGTDPCFALTVYNAATHTAAVAHIDYQTNLQSLATMLATIEPDQTKWTNLEVRLFGGFPIIGRSFAARIITELTKYNISLTSADILHKKHPTALVIDSQTGTVYRLPTIEAYRTMDDLYKRNRFRWRRGYAALTQAS